MRKDEPLISVIVPVYNGQDYLEKCIRSIGNQTYGKIEIIIVDDGSTDRTAAVCEKLQAEDDCVRVITMRDEGVSAARNAGIDASRGEMITFVDADDRLHPEMLGRLYDCMERTGSDVAGCRFFCWSGEDDWQRYGAAQDISARDRSEQVEVYDADSYLREALLQGNSRCWSKLYRRKCVERVRFTEGLSIGEDMLFLVKLLPYVDQIAESDYQGYGYYQNPAGAIRRKFTPAYMDQITCWQLAREEILRRDESLDAQVSALGIMGVMLTAGKLAMLRAGERRQNREFIGSCQDSLQEFMGVSGAYGRLSVGYRMKAGLFRFCPDLYLWLYHMQKSVRVMGDLRGHPHEGDKKP